ncbi:LON peptidase substrate-binding domain-containing protein [Spongiibacter sp. KMU-158]|uniref:LON peptidase substrate-binding domain-containing protein n=1 Tax=Spongiibacter pelagi TaxID=2760804 RepID=A0A927GWX6_9GAMM|nr:LON peptidase substrate-binding domain-containing protein [Spongiibacter pelagi]MBD2858859.1 LON peptidase substrate-binding domain-containing protein [Spongiibacter pelagi]
MAELQKDYPLFPLGMPLFPGGRMALRVFERRYLDLVRDCLRNDQGFGVVWLHQGAEVAAEGGDEIELAEYGVEARIVDWDQTKDGLLSITIEGVRRFRLEQFWLAESGLNRGDIEWCELGDEGDDSECQSELAPEIVEGLLANNRALLEALSEHPHVARLGIDITVTDIAGLVYRLAQLLPMPPSATYPLLEFNTPLGLLEELHSLLGEYADDHASD